MQSPIFPVIGQRFVARVNDGTIELYPLINVVDDVIGALAELKIHLALRLRRLEIERQGIRLSNASRAGKDLPGRPKSPQRSENRRWARRPAPPLRIFLGTESGT